LRRQNQIGAALAITSSIIWSGNFIVSRYAINLAGPVSLAFMRWTLATLFMLPFAYKNVKKEWPIFKANKVYFFWMGLIGFSIYNTLIYTAGHYTTAINMALFGSTVHPIVAALLAAYFVNEITLEKYNRYYTWLNWYCLFINERANFQYFKFSNWCR